MPKIEVLKTKTLNDGRVLQLNKVSHAVFRNGAVADIFEVSCHKKGDKKNRIGVERFLLPERGQGIFELRAASPDPAVVSGNRNNVDLALIRHFT